MTSSFQRGRSAAASMAGRAGSPKNKVSRGTLGSPAAPEIGENGNQEKDATKRDLRALGTALRVYREDRSREKVAQAAGIKRSQLSGYEQGKKEPRPQTLAKIAEALEVTVPAIEALAGLLSLAPELLDRSHDPAGAQALARAVRWVTRFRAAEATILAGGCPPPMAKSEHLGLKDIEANHQAELLWERLEPYTAPERRAIVLEGKEFQIWPLSRLLCQKSIDAASAEPSKALELAELAELISPLVAGRAASRLRLQGYCAFHVSNAHRVSGSLPAAAEALERAEELWHAGAAGDLNQFLSEARVLGLKASLRREQRRLSEALDLLDLALEIAGNGEMKYLLLNRAKTLEEMGKYEDAIATLNQARPHIDTEREPRLAWNQLMNVLVNLCRLERYAEAEQSLGELHELAQEVVAGVSQTRQTWLEGWIAAGMGRLEEAEAALSAVREEFLTRDIGYDAALASLDICTLYLQQGRTAAVKKLSAQIVTSFREQGVHREAMAAVRLFRAAAARELATVELARRLGEFLRRARHEVGVRFGG